MQLIKSVAAGLTIALVGSASAQHAWTVQSQSPGTTEYVGVSEDFLMTGQPWDTDGNGACPPDGDDDVRCEWLTDHTGVEAEHQMNGVIGAVLDTRRCRVPFGTTEFTYADGLFQKNPPESTRQAASEPHARNP